MPVDPIFLNEVGLEKADSSSPPPRLPCPRAQSLLRLAALSRLQSPASGCHCLLLLLPRRRDLPAFAKHDFKSKSICSSSKTQLEET